MDGLIIVLCSLIASVTCYPNGATLPSGKCGDMNPSGHPGSGQTGTAPYTITVLDATKTNEVDEYTAGTKYIGRKTSAI